jgi:hypothetical protein
MPGFFAVLHTGGRQLQYPPHIPYLVPGGALSSQAGQGHPSSPGCFLPVKAPSKVFRAKFRDQIEQGGLLGKVPPELCTVDWHVNCQAVGEGEATVKYLAP